MNFIHAFMHLIMLQEWTQKFSQDKCFAQVSPMLSIHVMFVDTSKSNLRFFLSDKDPLLWNGQIHIASRPSPWDWSSIPSHQGPLRSNGHWFLGCIEALCEAMVIDFFTSRPSPLEWSNPMCRIETLAVRVVIVSYAFSLGLAKSFDRSKPSTL